MALEYLTLADFTSRTVAIHLEFQPAALMDCGIW